MTDSAPAAGPPATGLESDHLLPRIHRAFRGGVAAVVAVAVTTSALYVYTTVNRNEVLHYRGLIDVAVGARALAIDRQAAIQGYLITGDTAGLAARRDPSALGALADSLGVLTGSDAAQHAAAVTAREALAAWESGYVAPLLRAALDRRGPAPDRASGEILFEPFRASLDALIATGQARLTDGVQRQRLVGAIGFLVVLAELLVISVALLLLRRRTLGQTRRLMGQQRTLQKQAIELELRATELERQMARTRAMADHLRSVNAELRETVEALSRARAEKQSALRGHEESRAALDVVLAGAPVGIALVDRALRYELVNEAYAAIDGARAEALRDGTVREATPELARVLEPAIARVFDTERPQLGIEIARAPSDHPLQTREWIVNVHPVRGPAGGVRAVGVVAIELTGQRQLERQLTHAQKMEAVGRLAGSIAHDFSNLLTAISAFAQFAEESVGEDTPARDDLEQILLATERGSALTRRLLSFSRQQVVEPRPVDLNRVIEDLDEMLRRLLGTDVTLETELAPQLWRIDADPGQLEQVIVNLVINARDAMPDGGRIVLRTSMAELDESQAVAGGDLHPGPHVMLAVTDTGTGMDADTQARAFEPFFTTKPAGKGTGLGLSTVYGIVRQFGGSIAFESEVGHGTTFRLAFPRCGAEENAAATEARAPEAVPLPPVSVLLVEDDATVRGVVHRALEQHGCTVHEAPHGTDALALLERLGGWVHLVISDLVMPEMGGLEFARAVREKSPTTRILFLSGHAAEARLRRGLSESGAFSLEKPFTADALVVRVREVLAAPDSTGGVAA